MFAILFRNIYICIGLVIGVGKCKYNCVSCTDADSFACMIITIVHSQVLGSLLRLLVQTSLHVYSKGCQLSVVLSHVVQSIHVFSEDDNLRCSMK